jgi:hypothetical protein
MQKSCVTYTFGRAAIILLLISLTLLISGLVTNATWIIDHPEHGHFYTDAEFNTELQGELDHFVTKFGAADYNNGEPPFFTYTGNNVSWAETLFEVTDIEAANHGTEIGTVTFKNMGFANPTETFDDLANKDKEALVEQVKESFKNHLERSENAVKYDLEYALEENHAKIEHNYKLVNAPILAIEQAEKDCVVANLNGAAKVTGGAGVVAGGIWAWNKRKQRLDAAERVPLAQRNPEGISPDTAEMMPVQSTPVHL